MSSIKGWDGDSWNDLGKNPMMWNGSSWGGPVNRIHGWNGSSWGLLWQRSDPITLLFNSHLFWTASFGGPSTSPAYGRAAYTFSYPTDDLIQGDWAGVGADGTPGDYHAVMRFDNQAIEDALAGRYNITSARLRLYNTVSNEPSGTPIYLWQVTGLPTTEPGALNVAAVRSGSYITGPTTNEGQLGWVPNSATLRSWVYDIVVSSSNGLCLFDPVSNPTFRGVFAGSNYNSGLRPALEITADYV